MHTPLEEETPMWKRVLAILFAITLVAAACGDDDAADTATADADETAPAAADASSEDEAAEDEMTDEEMAQMDDEEMAAPMTGPAEIAADDQTGDGSTVLIASVTLPGAGFVAIHSDGDGGPGPVIGHSDLLPAGESLDIVVTLDTMIDAETTLFPMLHIDANENGEYDFAPPDVTDDVPATKADDAVAVLPINYTIG